MRIRGMWTLDTVIHKKFVVKMHEVMKIFLHENSLPVLTYTVNIWHTLEVNENIITRKFLTQNFCERN